MSLKDQVISLIIKGRDLFSEPAKAAEQAVQDLSDKSKVLTEQLKKIESQQQAADALAELAVQAHQLTEQINAQRTATETVVASFDQAKAAVKALTTDQAAAEKQFVKNSAELAKLSAKLDEQVEKSRLAAAEVQRLTSEQKQAEQALAQVTLRQAEATKQQAAAEKAYRDSGSSAKELKQALSDANAELRTANSEFKTAESDVSRLSKALEKASTAQDKANTAYIQTSTRISELNTAQDALMASTSATSTQIREQEKALQGHREAADGAKTELRNLEQELSKNQRTAQKHAKTLADAEIDTKDLGEASRKLAAQQRAAEQAITETNKELTKHQRLLAESKKGAADFAGSIGSATRSLVAMAGAYVGIDRLWDSLKSILTTGDEYKKLEAQMAALMGTMREGQSATQWIKEFANTTGTKIDTVRESFVLMKSMGLDPMNGSLQSLVDYGAKVGASQEKLQGIILAVSQMWAKQKIQGDEVIQLAERGIPVWDLLAKATGKNVAELMKMSENSQLTREYISLLLDEIGKASTGQAAESLNRLGGQFNVLSNNWEEFKRTIADSGVYKVATQFIKDLNDRFKAMAEDGSLKNAAQKISDFFSDLITNGGPAIKSTLENIGALATGVNVVVSSIRIAVNAFTAGVSGIAGVYTGIQAKILAGTAALLDAIGADKIAAKVRQGSEAIQAISDAYIKQVEQDSKDMKAAWDSMTKDAAESHKKLGDSIKTTNDEVARDTTEKLGTVSEEVANAVIEKVFALRTAAQKLTDEFNVQQKAFSEGQITSEQLATSFQAMAEAQLRLAKETQSGVPETLKQQAALLNLESSLQAAARATGMLSDAQVKAEQAAADYQAQMLRAGITSVKSLQDQEAAAKKTYDTVKAAMDQGIGTAYELEQAYQKWAEASIKASTAQGKLPSDLLRTEAAANGFQSILTSMVLEQYKFNAMVDESSRLLAPYISRINEAREAIGRIETELKAHNVTLERRAQLSKELAYWQDEERKSREKLQFAEEQGLKSSRQLLNEKQLLERQLERLSTAYGRGSMTSAEFGVKQEAISERLRIVNELLGDFANQQGQAKQSIDATNSSLDEQSAALQKSGQAANESREFVNLFAGAHEHLNKQFDYSNTSISDMDRRLEDLNRSIAANNQVTDGWWQMLAKQSNEAFEREKRIIEETKAYQAMQQQLKSNTLTLSQLKQMSSEVKYGFQNLDQTKLSQLTNSIDEARTRLLSLRDDLKGTVSSLQNELDKLNNKGKSAEEIELLERRSQLQKKLAEAQAIGDEAAQLAAQKALSLAEQIAATKSKQAAQEKAQQEAADKAAALAEQQKQAAQTQTTSTTTQSTFTSFNREPDAVFRLLVGDVKIDAATSQSILEQLLNEIKRQQQLGG